MALTSYGPDGRVSVLLWSCNGVVTVVYRACIGRVTVAWRLFSGREAVWYRRSCNGTVCAICQILLGWETNTVVKPTNSPTQGQPNPRINRLKVAFGALFLTELHFRGLRLILYRKQTTRVLTQPDCPQTPWSCNHRWQL